MISLKITAPFATFTDSYSREYAASYSYPPPATIYGLLLALVGETNKTQHLGVKIAIGLLSIPKSCTVIRTFKRRKQNDINHKENTKPENQEILCGLKLVVCVDSDAEKNNLENRILQALESPETINRFGGLSLGESRDLLDELDIIDKIPKSVQWLVKNYQGEIVLPTWVDYLGSENTRWQTFSLGNFSDEVFCQINGC